MTPLLFTGLCLAGGIGAGCRFVLDGVIRTKLLETRGANFPWATLIINATGSLLLGLLTGMVSSGVLPEEWQLVAGVGFLGGYTTFSTASVETIDLFRQKRPRAGLLYGIGVLCITVALAGVGLWLGAQLS